MAKFFIVLALATVAAALDHPSLGIATGGYGYNPFGGGLGGYQRGLNKQVTVGRTIGGYPYGGVSKQYTSVGSSISGYPSYSGIGVGGVSKHYSSVGVGGYPGGIGGYPHGGGQGLGISKRISSFGTTVGGNGPGVLKASQVNHISSHYGGLGGLGGFSSLGYGGLGQPNGHHHHHHHHSLSGLSTINRLSVPSVSTIPGGYYGGFVSYPQSIPTTISTNSLHIPGAAVDAYRGYYAGYYPGSVGYGSSYRFFH